MRIVIFVFFCVVFAIPCQAACDPNISGDISGDCKVDFNDFSLLANEWFVTEELEPSNVIQEWVMRYDGSGSDSDNVQAITTDNQGNVYVTGSSTGAGTETDYATIKYNSNGNEEWVSRYNGPGNTRDIAQAIALDSTGNIYITGGSEDSDGYWDYATIKYNPNGTELWVTRYDGLINRGSIAQAIAIDASNNVYVTGYSKSASTDYDYATIKYDAGGNEIWVARYDGPDNNVDMAFDMAIDNSGSVYVTGRSEGAGPDYATIKYTPDSNVPVWIARYNSGNWDIAHAIAIDSKNNVYVTGESGSLGNSDYATIKYDSSGNKLWAMRVNGTNNASDGAKAIALDNTDNVYVTGYLRNSGTEKDYCTIKYDTNGVELWVAMYDGPISKADGAEAIAIDNYDNIYVTGFSEDTGSDNADYATIIYASDSNEPVWVARYAGPSDYLDRAMAIAVDNTSNVYVTGESMNPTEDTWDYATIKYSFELICTTEITGDIDNNCKVDFNDLTEITSHWLDCNLDPQSACWE